ncbi:LPS export ABC transporter periplasmic protein LptC [Cellvibrio sp. OA-2007]|uniref:LPS export ABC transporter periplasmic protein LptC n=1 Tax=Cellvibrio sp. OA-2007 TaxID=529823 RepID=UPI0007808D89|nr:LPS export ABC transporter periplasmic protein LptC [Cellvibrio sp. OA-2007]
MAFLQRIYKIHEYIPAPWLIAFALVICFFAFSLRQKAELANHEYDPSGFPQFYMQEVKTREFDSQGRLHYQLSTPQITHYQLNPDGPSDRDYTLIQHPDMAFYDAESAAPWLVTAETGRSEANAQLIRLLDNVLIQQQTPTQGLIQITTSELRVRASEQFAETDKAVKMRSAKGQIDAIGMDADLAQSRLQLKSQVKAVYDPR